MAEVDVLVIGGGMVGMSLSVALADAGIKTAVVERHAPGKDLDQDFDGRTCSLAHASAMIFEGLGVWPFLAADAGPIYDIRVVDGNFKDGISSLFLHYNHEDVGDDPFGYIVENRVIRSGLAQRAAALKPLKVYAPAAVEELVHDSHGVEAKLNDGKTIKARLAVAAEGKFSPTRDNAGISTRQYDYKQTAIVCSVGHQEPHDGVAVELFLPSGPFAMLPMTGNRMNLVWTETTELAQNYLSLDDGPFLQEVKKRFGDWLGDLELLGPRFSYPLSLQTSNAYTDTRLALIGDAAHVIHPIAGQGLNLGLRDVAVLAEVIVDAHRLGLDVGSGTVLENYENWRRPDVFAMATVTHSLNKLFSNDIAPLRLARDLGLAAVDKAGPLKRLFMRHAMGVVGNLPRLVAGDPL
ncbi:MAG: UbiH/UbiF/VisC/COQ6 family ubiquinone biosynthesis hydroxylase [Rhodospirillales bacterium]|nr:UbiH/UbiF/VisC/COQ6 family ubiquinone biosynthesis hydroxylase [Rhodospirillales bacterium]